MFLSVTIFGKRLAHFGNVSPVAFMKLVPYVLKLEPAELNSL